MSSQPTPDIPLRGAVDLSTLASPAGGTQSAPAPTGDVTVLDVTEQSLQELAEQSSTVPVLMVMTSASSPASIELVRRLSAIVDSYQGKFALGACDVDEQQAIAQAFQVQAVPAVLALVGGRPAPLFQGSPDDKQIREVLDQVLEIAVQAGITGTVAGPADAETEPEPEPLPPLHQEAFDAIERDDLPAAIDAFERALKENPKDADARAGLAQVRLMSRVRDLDLHAARAAAADAPADVAAQMDVADLDVSGGKVEDALARLIDVVRVTSGEERETVRQRLIELFDVVGADDPRVMQARQALASALY